MLHKSFEIIESKADQQAGTFEALVSVFGNVDRGGDRVLPGAFSKTLERWRATGDPIPVILSHQWDNPMAHIGVADPFDVVETEKGLRVKATLDVADNEVARQVYRLLKRRSLKEFSFGYDVPKGGQKRAKDGANELTELNLVEVGPTLKGMNDATELYAVKSALSDPPRSADELRHAAATLEREETDRQLPDVPDPQPEPEPEPVPEPEPQPVPAVAEQRAKADEVARAETRKQEQAILPDNVPDPEPEPEPEPQPKPEPVPAAAEQRAKAERLASRERRDREERILPADVSPAAPEPGPDVAEELEQVKAALAEVRETLAALAAKADAPDPQDLRRRAEQARREQEQEGLPTDLPEQVEADDPGPDGGPKKTPEALDAIVNPDDVEGAKSGHLKAVWSVAYVNDLPDSAFLYIEPGGDKDADGKTTPRSLRHFPYKDADGTIDLPHLRNALARIPQSQNISQSVKDELTARAQRILDAQKSAEVTGKDRSGGRSVDPLREQADSFALEFASGGLSLRKPPRTVAPSPPELLPLGELKQRMRDEMLRHLSEDQATS